MNEKITEQRRHPRHDIPLQASLRAAGTVVPCLVHNISAGGALIEVNAQLRIGDRAEIKFADYGTMAGRVARLSSTTAGIAFDDGEAAMKAFIEQWLALDRQGGTEPPDEADRQAV